MKEPGKIVVIVGPTGVGKTALSLALAKRFHGEIVSADSRQVYRGLNIGTEKISKKEMHGIRHHLIDVANPKRSFSASEFRKQGLKAIASIQGRGNLPFVVGGTGFYIQALVDGILLPEVPPNPKLRKVLEKKNADELYQLLKKKDPARAKTIDRNNPRRLVRALEIVEALGKVPSPEKRSHFDVLWIGIKPPHSGYENVLRLRLHGALKQGLLKEVSALMKRGLTKKRIKELGLEYRTSLEHFEGKLTRNEMAEKMTTELKQYAKRQMTWFKRDSRIMWYTQKDSKDIEKCIETFLHPQNE